MSDRSKAHDGPAGATRLGMQFDHKAESFSVVLSSDRDLTADDLQDMIASMGDVMQAICLRGMALTQGIPAEIQIGSSEESLAVYRSMFGMLPWEKADA
ncbi:MAG TPA: hypothetical protein VN838_12115 [Bradyrhizobium sp.]|nr:hypothetical protein [Bradyrhizobium sp.]